MKTSAILVSACATLALATPVVVKREIKTEVVFQYITITVTGTGPSPTAEPTVEPTTEAPVVEPTTEPTVEPTVVESTEDQTGTPGAFFSAPASVESEAPAVSVPQVDTSGLSAYALPVLTQHNLHRANHSASPLEWDDYLVNAAQMLADTCVYGHNTKIGGGGYGQNIGADSIGPDNVPGMITNGMYNNEMINYHSYGGEPNSADLGSYGHFTQIVWKGSNKVGCATAHCDIVRNQDGDVMPGFSYFSVCNYSPPGNYIGQYADNVGAPLGEATITI